MDDATLVTVAGPRSRAPARRGQPARLPRLDHPLPDRRGDGGARGRERGIYYGRYGTPTTFALEEALAALEGGHRSIVVGSGKTAITSTLLALLAAGDHLLMADTVYAPTRHFCDRHADPLRHRDHLLRPRDRRRHRRADPPRDPARLHRERRARSPSRCRTSRPSPRPRTPRGCLVVMDNTWASPAVLQAVRAWAPTSRSRRRPSMSAATPT